MEGFKFFDHYSTDPRRGEFVFQERLFLNSIRDLILSGGANLNRILHHRNEADLIFITAFHTGKGGASLTENRKQNKELAWDIQGLGYGFIQVKGHYVDRDDDEEVSYSEESYCVISYKENTQEFVACLSELANKYGQQAILVVPKEEDAYLLYHTGEKKVLGRDLHILTEAIKNYTSIKGHHFAFGVVSGLRFRDGDSLSPIRKSSMFIDNPGDNRRVLLQNRATDFLVKLMR